jgi:hypothetical protein
MMFPSIRILALIPLAASMAHGQTCVTFRRNPPKSQCLQFSTKVSWEGRPETPETEPVAVGTWEPLLDDPAYADGVGVSGGVRFEFPEKGSQVLDILAVATGPVSSFTLLVGGKPTDTRYEAEPGPERLMPSTRARPFSLLARFNGPATVEVRTVSPRWQLVALRIRSAQDYELYEVSRMRRRLEERATQPIYGIGERGASLRAQYLFQLGERLELSSNLAARREGIHAQARSLYWLACENHRPGEVIRASALIGRALRTLPDDEKVRQMASAACLGTNTSSGRSAFTGDYCQWIQPVPWSVELAPDPAGAPAWAAAQRRLAARMDAITQWWVKVRQLPNGELGGGWGDDVEILRSWGPLALGFGSSIASEGIRLLADGLWTSGVLKNGYSATVSDVEHSSEPTTDTLPLRAAIRPGEPEAISRLRMVSACAANWIQRQPDGFWRFRSSWFNCGEADISPQRALDVHMNTRAMGPALWYAALSRDSKTIDLLRSWGESWVRAMSQSAAGKPAGLFPPVLKSADGSYLVGSSDWAKPDAEWDYYQWSPAAQESLTSLLLALHDLTGESKWLDAAGTSLKVVRQCAGAEALCESMKQAPEAFLEWRRRTGDSSLDSAFGYAAPPDDAEVLSRMGRMAKQMEERLAVNFDMLTSEVLWTDRVYYTLPTEFRNHLFGGESPRGDRYPTFAVTWGPGRAPGMFVARVVLAISAQSTRLALYNFDESEADVPLYLWRMKPGRYRIRANGQDREELKVAFRPQPVMLRVPPRVDWRVELIRLGE